LFTFSGRFPFSSGDTRCTTGIISHNAERATIPGPIRNGRPRLTPHLPHELRIVFVLIEFQLFLIRCIGFGDCSSISPTLTLLSSARLVIHCILSHIEIKTDFRERRVLFETSLVKVKLCAIQFPKGSLCMLLATNGNHLPFARLEHFRAAKDIIEITRLTHSTRSLTVRLKILRCGEGLESETGVYSLILVCFLVRCGGHDGLFLSIKSSNVSGFGSALALS
jgi:hypothetical protein